MKYSRGNFLVEKCQNSSIILDYPMHCEVIKKIHSLLWAMKNTVTSLLYMFLPGQQCIVMHYNTLCVFACIRCVTWVKRGEAGCPAE